eukprot:1290625-Amphidinium_carterae.1
MSIASVRIGHAVSFRVEGVNLPCLARLRGCENRLGTTGAKRIMQLKVEPACKRQLLLSSLPRLVLPCGGLEDLLSACIILSEPLLGKPRREVRLSQIHGRAHGPHGILSQTSNGSQALDCTSELHMAPETPHPLAWLDFSMPLDGVSKSGRLRVDNWILSDAQLMAEDVDIVNLTATLEVQ